MRYSVYNNMMQHNVVISYRRRRFYITLLVCRLVPSVQLFGTKFNMQSAINKQFKVKIYAVPGKLQMDNNVDFMTLTT